MPAFASERAPIIVPKHVIYAGQQITPAFLRNRDVPLSYISKYSLVTEPSEIVGMVAKVTLAPNRPIPTNYLKLPEVVKVNRRAILRYLSGALSITAEVMPMNSAQAGASVQARNIRTGVIVYGVAMKDGTIMAGFGQ